MATEDIGRWIATIGGGVLAMVKPTLPYIIICTLMIFADCLTAWQLSRRVKKAHPEKVKKDTGKFDSHHAGKVFITLMKSWALILIAHFIGMYITDSIPIDLAKVAAGSICFWQLWSILENESSCNGARWAKIAQRIFVDKTERHFHLDLHELKDDTQ